MAALAAIMAAFAAVSRVRHHGRPCRHRGVHHHRDRACRRHGPDYRLQGCLPPISSRGITRTRVATDRVSATDGAAGTDASANGFLQGCQP